MSDNLAAEHADSLAANIWRRTNAGAPFGLLDESEEWTDDTDAYVSFADDTQTPYTEASAMDYLTDVLDIQYLVDSDRTYRAARILISFGGPNVWIDTRAGVLEVTWGVTAIRDLPNSFVDQLDEALAELWEVGD